MIRIMMIWLFLILLWRCTSSEEKIEYYDTGKIKFIATYEGSKKNGIQKDYYSNGKLKSISNYSNDTLNGVRETYYNNGKISSRINYVKGKKNGNFSNFKKEGFLAGKGFYKNDLRKGKLYEYYPSDSVKVKSECYIILAESHEFLYYSKTFNESGKLLSDDRTLKVDYLIKKNIIDLTISYLDTVRYDSMKVIIGSFSDEFQPISISDLDTIAFKNNEINVHLKNKGNVIRGKFLGYRTNTFESDSMVDYSTTFGFFEERIP